jgi:hypothetical protein
VRIEFVDEELANPTTTDVMSWTTETSATGKKGYFKVPAGKSYMRVMLIALDDTSAPRNFFVDDLRVIQRWSDLGDSEPVTIGDRFTVNDSFEEGFKWWVAGPTSGAIKITALSMETTSPLVGNQSLKMDLTVSGASDIDVHVGSNPDPTVARYDGQLVGIGKRTRTTTPRSPSIRSMRIRCRSRRTGSISSTGPRAR